MYSLVQREPLVVMDRLHLIAEVYIRPALWDLEHEKHTSHYRISPLWKEVANAMGPNVKASDCKRVWKALCSVYQTEVMCTESRIEMDILDSRYDSKNDYRSTWYYFEHMKFLKHIKNKFEDKIETNYKPSFSPKVRVYQRKKRNQNDNKYKPDSDSKSSTQRAQILKTLPICIKEEPELIINADSETPSEERNYIKPCENNNILQSNMPRTPATVSSGNDVIITGSESKTEYCLVSPSKQYANINIEQKSDVATANTIVNAISNLQEVSSNINSAKRRRMTTTSKSGQKEIYSNNKSSMEKSNIPTDNVYIKNEPVDSEEGTGIDTRKNTSPSLVGNKESNESDIIKERKIDVNDRDCNFLISFLPYMKKMSSLQNLQFRAKISNLTLSFYSFSNTTELNTLEMQMQNCLLKALSNIGDSDCNFLISFLPYMKSMPGLQNLKYRAKISELMFNVCSTSAAANSTSCCMT